MSKRRHDVASTLIRRCFDITCLLSLSLSLSLKTKTLQRGSVEMQECKKTVYHTENRIRHFNTKWNAHFFKNTPLSMILFHLFDNSRFHGLILQFYARIQTVSEGGGCNFNFSFKSARVETREDPNTTISGPSSARQRSAIYMAFRWRADDGPTLKAVLVALWFCSGDPDLSC